MWMMKIHIADRFWNNVVKTQECWIWGASTYRNGYGRIRESLLNGKRPGKLAHRVAWELTYGPIPSGMLVLHRCDRPSCCRPVHLFLGTQKENMQDAGKKGRLKSKGQHKGELNGQVKITAKDVLKIRAATGSQVSIAKRFGIKQAQVSRIKLRQSWRHLDGE
jgi:hypothetical protein